MVARYLNKPEISSGQEIFPTDLLVFSSYAQKTLWRVPIRNASATKGDIFQRVMNYCNKDILSHLSNIYKHKRTCQLSVLWEVSQERSQKEVRRLKLKGNNTLSSISKDKFQMHMPY